MYSSKHCEYMLLYEFSFITKISNDMPRLKVIAYTNNIAVAESIIFSKQVRLQGFIDVEKRENEETEVFSIDIHSVQPSIDSFQPLLPLHI